MDWGGGYTPPKSSLVGMKCVPFQQAVSALAQSMDAEERAEGGPALAMGSGLTQAQCCTVLCTPSVHHIQNGIKKYPPPPGRLKRGPLAGTRVRAKLASIQQSIAIDERLKKIVPSPCVVLLHNVTSHRFRNVTGSANVHNKNKNSFFPWGG